MGAAKNLRDIEKIAERLGETREIKGS